MPINTEMPNAEVPSYVLNEATKAFSEFCLAGDGSDADSLKRNKYARSWEYHFAQLSCLVDWDEKTNFTYLEYAHTVHELTLAAIINY